MDTWGSRASEAIDVPSNGIEVKIEDLPWEELDVQTCVLAIREGMVNLSDLLNMMPGGVIRCRGNPSECIKVLRIKSEIGEGME